MDMEKAEEELLFGNKDANKETKIFLTNGSAGANPVKLAQILAAHDIAMTVLGWTEKPLANLPLFLSQYQASVGGRYHDDYKQIQIAEEVENKRANRKGMSLSLMGKE